MGYPDLLIVASNSMCDEMDCDAVHHLHGSQSVSTIYPNVYEYIVDPPLPVRQDTSLPYTNHQKKMLESYSVL